MLSSRLLLESSDAASSGSVQGFQKDDFGSRSRLSKRYVEEQL